jgi:HTH-type transcriptional regulator/antitoxin HigA
MPAKTIPHAMPAGYFDLIRQFPLVSIRDDAHLEAAFQVIDNLLTRDLDEGRRAYLDALTDLVGTYEDEHVAIPDASEADVLRELMDGNRLTQSQLASEVGIPQSTLSAVLRGERSLTKGHILKLAARFRVPAAVFLPR